MPHVSCISAFKTRLKSRSILWVTMFFSIQVLPPFPRLSPFDLRQRFGLHDDVKAEVKIVIFFFFERWEFPPTQLPSPGRLGQCAALQLGSLPPSFPLNGPHCQHRRNQNLHRGTTFRGGSLDLFFLHKLFKYF